MRDKKSFNCWVPPANISSVPIANGNSFILESSDSADGPITFSTIIDRNTKIRFVDPRFRLFRRGNTIFIGPGNSIFFGFSTSTPAFPPGMFYPVTFFGSNTAPLSFPVSGGMNDGNYNGVSYIPPMESAQANFAIDINLNILISGDTGSSESGSIYTLINGIQSGKQTLPTSGTFNYQYNTVTTLIPNTPQVTIFIERASDFAGMFSYNGSVIASGVSP